MYICTLDTLITSYFMLCAENNTKRIKFPFYTTVKKCKRGVAAPCAQSGCAKAAVSVPDAPARPVPSVAAAGRDRTHRLQVRGGADLRGHHARALAVRPVR